MTRVTRLRVKLRRARRRVRKFTRKISHRPLRGYHRARAKAVRQVRYLRYLSRKREAQVGQMSPNFHVREFACKDGSRVPEYAYPALRQLCQTYLEPLRERFGAIHVTSGFRHQAYNARIGGASLSLHRYELHRDAVAADVVCATGTPGEWAAFLEGLSPGGLCPYPSSNFVHVDNRQRVGMASARWGA